MVRTEAERERDVRLLLDVTARRETVPTMCTSNRGAWGRSGGPRSIHLRSTIKLPRPNAERELLYEEERVVRTMARGTSGTVRELALLDGVTHSARSPVCLIKHHAGCWGVRVLVTERAVCVAVVVVRAAGLVLRNQLESRVRPCVGCAQRPARLVLVETNSDLDNSSLAPAGLAVSGLTKKKLWIVCRHTPILHVTPSGTRTCQLPARALSFQPQPMLY